MSYTREWAFGAWSDRESLTYSQLDREIVTENGKKAFCDSYGRIVPYPQAGLPRPVINFDDTNESVWYLSFSTLAEQAIFRVTFN